MLQTKELAKFVIVHCLRDSEGGEEVAIRSIESLSTNYSVHFYPKKGYVKSILVFFFSLSFALFVLNNKDKRFIFSNPFPFISIPSILLLRCKGISLRWYVHNFGVSCPANTHYKDNTHCFTSCDKGNRDCMTLKCNPSIQHYLLNLLRNKLFFRLFLNGPLNKFYFVSSYQANLAKKTGVERSKIVVAGNVV